MENFVVRSSKRHALFFATLAFFMGFAGVSAYGPIVPMLKKILSLDPFFMSLLAAAPALTGSLLRIPFGAMVDKTGGKKPIIILLALSAAGIAGMSWLTSLPKDVQVTMYGFFIGFGMLAGCGIAVFSVGVPVVSYWFPQKAQGSALAIYGGLANLAPGLFALLLPFLIIKFGFGYSYIIWLSMLALTGLSIALFMHDAPSFQLKTNGHHVDHNNDLHKKILKEKFAQELVPSGKIIGSLALASAKWNTWALTIIYFLTFGGFVALTSWLPIFWTEGFGIGIVTAGTLTAVYSLSTSLMRVTGGFISDRFGGERTLLVSLLTIFAGSIAMVVSKNIASAVAAELILAVGMGVGNAAVFKLVPKFTPTTVGGTAGIVGGLGALGGFIIPLTLGSAIGFANLSYTKVFLIFLLLSIVSLLVFKTLRSDEK